MQEVGSIELVGVDKWWWWCLMIYSKYPGSRCHFCVHKNRWHGFSFVTVPAWLPYFCLHNNNLCPSSAKSAMGIDTLQVKLLWWHGEQSQQDILIIESQGNDTIGRSRSCRVWYVTIYSGDQCTVIIVILLISSHLERNLLELMSLFPHPVVFGKETFAAFWFLRKVSNDLSTLHHFSQDIISFVSNSHYSYKWASLWFFLFLWSNTSHNKGPHFVTLRRYVRESSIICGVSLSFWRLCLIDDPLHEAFCIF